MNFKGNCGSSTQPYAKRTWFIVLQHCNFPFTILIQMQNCQYSWKRNTLLCLAAWKPSPFLCSGRWLNATLRLRPVASSCSYLHTFCFYIPQPFSCNCAMSSAKNKNAENSPPLQEREQYLPGSALQFPLGDNMRNRLRSWRSSWLCGEQPLSRNQESKPDGSLGSFAPTLSR